MCRANRVIDNKSNCNIYLWCKENKTKIILDYILENTDGFIKDRVFIYNTKDKIIIFPHCFYDYPHRYRSMIFPDFYEHAVFFMNLSKSSCVSLGQGAAFQPKLQITTSYAAKLG
jgi:hypothetical protein